MKNGTFIPVTRVQSRPDVKSDGKARFGDNNPTITQQGIDVDKFIIGQLRKEGLLPAFDQHSPRKTRKNATTGKKKETMTTTSKLTVDKITATKLTPVGTISVGPQATADQRTIIANALVGIFDAVSALQRTAFQANDKVVYGFATKLLTGELMDIKANYSKDAK